MMNDERNGVALAPSKLAPHRLLTASAFWCVGNNEGKLCRETLPTRDEESCLIRTLYSVISPGTERVIFTGQVPEGLYEEMRVPYMGGHFSFPLKYGYSLVGTVLEGPAKWCGKTVHVMHPHQDNCVVRCNDIVAVPPGVPPARAALASCLETAVNAVWDADVRIGDHALVVGFGAIGSLVARLLAATPGVQVSVKDVHPGKQRLAELLGFTVYDQHTLNGEFDVAFHTSGTTEGLQFALDHVGFEGRVAELSWYGRRAVKLYLGDTFHSRRKAIISSQVSAVSPRQRPRWDGRRRRELVFRLLADPAFDTHLSQRVSFNELPAFFPRLAEAPADYLSILVTYKGAADAQRNGSA